jgi:hypothetical protein
LSDGIDSPSDLVPGNARVLNAWIVSLFDQHITVTDTASLNLDTNLTPSGLRDRAFDNFEISTRFADLNGFHEDLSEVKLRVLSREPREDLYWS